LIYQITNHLATNCSIFFINYCLPLLLFKYNSSLGELLFKELLTIEVNEYIYRYQKSFQRIYRSVSNMLKQHVHEDITTEQFTFLQFIHEEQTVTASEIAQVFGVGRSAITAVVNRLEQKELIVRKRNETDRRIVHISLTRKGKKVVL